MQVHILKIYKSHISKGTLEFPYQQEDMKYRTFLSKCILFLLYRQNKA